MSFDEQQMAYAFPCTHLASNQRQEPEAPATDLRAELIDLASQRYQSQQDALVTTVPLEAPDAVSESLPVSPNADFCTYADLICKMTSRLGITTSQPQTPVDDVFFEVLQAKSSSVLALPLSKVLLDSVKASWARPASVPVSNKKLDHMYRVQETSAEFLFTHPKPNSIVVSSSSKSRWNHTIPQDREGKKWMPMGTNCIP